MTHQWAACYVASVHFGLTLRRNDSCYILIGDNCAAAVTDSGYFWMCSGYKEAKKSEHISAVSLLLSAKQCHCTAAESAITNNCLGRKWLRNKGYF